MKSRSAGGIFKNSRWSSGCRRTGRVRNLHDAGSAQAADALPKKWDQTVDVVVIGSGFAGLAAAIEAKEAGRRWPFMKMPMHGGNSIINGGVMAVAGSDMAEARGIKDNSLI